MKVRSPVDYDWPQDGSAWNHSSHSNRPILQTLGFASVCAICIGLIIYGIASLTAYEWTPGDMGRPSPRWPSGSAISLSANRPTLLMFAHPRCPCTRSSIGELARLMTHVQELVNAHVLFFTPEATSDNWPLTDLWTAAERIPGVSVHADPGGGEAKRFGAETSGHTVLYDVQGNLIFLGGITASRGHAGDNIGSRAIESLLRKGFAHAKQTPTFGCSLLEPSAVESLEGANPP